MKKLILLFSLIFLLSMAGCSMPGLPQKEEAPVIEQTEEAVEETKAPAAEAPVPAETEPPVTEPEAPVGILETEYYTLTLPEYWIGKCVSDLHNRDDGSYSMSVHETQAFFEFGGGTLFTIMMLPTGEDYSIFPSYELIGALDTPHGTFNLVALFPTDVQFTEATAQVYNQMNESVMDVLYSITAQNGAELAMP